VGLRLERRLFDGTVAEMSSRICLVEKAAGTLPFPAAAAGRDYGRHWTPVHVDFTVGELEGSLERAVKAGARLEDGPEAYPWGRIATLSDPFGNGFCLIEWKAGGY
jgi:predicted enzyme related to lactoylglutathione lyase